MKLYDFVNEGLVPVLTEIGVWMNKHKSKQTTKLYKTLSTSCVCAHPCSHCRTLVCHMSCVWRHPCFCKGAKSPLCTRHSRFLKGRNRIFPLCAGTLSWVILQWLFTGTAPCYCFWGGWGGIGFDENFKSCAVCN